jgi:8-oxo-dGTP pyrophosphatase MutT (NUDIX family)
MEPLHHFNIRVYGIIRNEEGSILVSDEFQLGQRMTKFPGGGLHFGEGTLDCLRREAMEEFGQELEITSHFYTTDFFQKALFYPDHQLISIYYEAHFQEAPRFPISQKEFDFEKDVNGSQSFRWVKPEELKTESFTFPIDRKVCGMLKQMSPR